MREYARIEEPPPIHRTDRTKPARRGVGPLTGWRPRLSAAPTLNLRGLLRPGPTKLAGMILVAATVIGLQAWTLHRLARVRAELTTAGANLEEARASLGMLWDVTDRLDEDRIAGLGQLADSIRSVFVYAQGEVRLWETAYQAQERRLDENAGRIARGDEAITRLTSGARATNARLDQLGRVDAAQQGRLAALENQDRTQGASIEALARRAETQEASVRGANSTLGSLRETLAGLDAELARLEQRVESSGSAYGQISTRMESLDGWIEEFRRAGLDGDALDSRLASLADEVRRVRIRVDSLRSARPVVRTGQPGG
jgi:chromosome segregation ATPase